MHSKRKVVITGLALVVSLSLLFASAAAVYAGGEFRPLAGVFNWFCSSTGICMEVRNTQGPTIWGIGSGSNSYINMVGLNNSTSSSGQGIQGAFHGSAGYGVVGYNSTNIGVRGVGGIGSGDYGGYFSGFEGVRGNATGANGYGTWGYATGSSGVGAAGIATGSSAYGVYGYSRNVHGVLGVGGTSAGRYGGYFVGYNGTFGRGSGSTGYGVYGYAPWEGVRGIATATNGWGVFGQATNTGGWAGVFISSRYRGLYADGAAGFYDAFFPNMIRAGSTTISSFGMAFNALNAGGEALEPGDLVAFSGFVTAAEGSEPTLSVVKANGANSHAIIGAVQSAYVTEELPAEAMHMQSSAQAVAAPAGIEKEVAPVADPLLVEGEGDVRVSSLESQPEAIEAVPAPAMETPAVTSPGVADAGRFVEGSAAPGQHVVVIVQGISRVNVDASAAPIRAGDMLVASGTGYAVNASVAAQADGASQPRDGVVDSGDRDSRRAPASQVLTVGRALESLESGTGAIYVFVSVR